MIDLEKEPLNGEKKVNKVLVRVGSGWSQTDRKGKKCLSCQLDLDSLDVSEKLDKDGNLKQVINITIYPCKRDKEVAPNYSVNQLKESEPDEFIDDGEF